MLGAIIGDIAGSRFEFNNHRSKDFDLFTSDCFVTDDSIMTLAIAKAILSCEGDWLSEQAIKFMQEIGRNYPDCGFGSRFNRWIFSDAPKPYDSFGNGAAMRVSPCGFIAGTEEEAKSLARKVTEVTHNHPEGLRGAEATTVAIYLARTGATKAEIRERIENDYYELDFCVDELRVFYEFNETCQETVPQAIVCFLESISFDDAIRNAISIGGDSDTLAAITGAIAEAYYDVPPLLKRKALTYLDAELRRIFREWERVTKAGLPVRKFDLLTKYIGKFEDDENQLDFSKEFFVFIQSNPDYELQNFQPILIKNGLKWTEASMKSADASALDDQTVLALLCGVYQAEHFSEGVLESFVRDAVIDNWLMRLKVIDDERKPEKVGKVLKQVRMLLEPFEKTGQVSELLVTENQIMIQSSSQEGVKVVHLFEIGGVSDLGVICLNRMSDCLGAQGWQDSAEFDGVGFAINRFELEAQYEDGDIVAHSGPFDRAHMPEQEFIAFVEMIHILIHSFGFGSIVGLSGFMFALKNGEVKYCGVEFSDSGRLYHYRTTDLRIVVGDEVIVPVGENDQPRKAMVRTIAFCRWDDTPYPLERTKEIIGLVSDER